MKLWLGLSLSLSLWCLARESWRSERLARRVAKCRALSLRQLGVSPPGTPGVQMCVGVCAAVCLMLM